jgi:hypothetical protein
MPKSCDITGSEIRPSQPLLKSAVRGIVTRHSAKNAIGVALKGGLRTRGPFELVRYPLDGAQDNCAAKTLEPIGVQAVCTFKGLFNRLPQTPA